MSHPLRHVLRFSLSFLPVAVAVAGLGIAYAQDVEFRGDPAPAHNPPAFAGPQELVGKSIDDLSKGKFGAAARDDIKALRRGPLLIHGNYCGIGNRPGAPPVDALDAACMRHDACTHTNDLPSCRCDDRLRAEADEIAHDPASRPEIVALATAMSASMAVLVCK